MGSLPALRLDLLELRSEPPYLLPLAAHPAAAAGAEEEEDDDDGEAQDNQNVILHVELLDVQPPGLLLGLKLT